MCVFYHLSGVFAVCVCIVSSHHFAKAYAGGRPPVFHRSVNHRWAGVVMFPAKGPRNSKSARQNRGEMLAIFSFGHIFPPWTCKVFERFGSKIPKCINRKRPKIAVYAKGAANADIRTRNVVQTGAPCCGPRGVRRQSYPPRPIFC